MYIVFIIVALICAFFMIIAVLLQKSKKEGGLDPMATGTTQLIGISKTTDLLEKITWTLAFSIAFCSMLSTIFLKKSMNKTMFIESPNVKAAQKKALITQSKKIEYDKEK